MDKLHSNIIQLIYEYDNTYKIKFGKVLTQLSAHCFIYNCQICFKEWGNCFCYCQNYRTYLRFCHQIYDSKGSVYENDLNDIIALSG